MTIKHRKRLLVLSVSAGAGHVRAAQAICAAAESAGDFEATHLDVMDLVPAAFRKAYAESYLQLIDRAPLLWAHLYARTNRRSRESRMDLARRTVERLDTRRVMAEIERQAPSAIVCTHFLPAELLSRRIRRERPTPPVIVQVTDFDVHGLWIHEHMAAYCVASDEVAARIADRGIGTAQVHVTGIPLASAFRALPARAEVRRELGIPAAEPLAIMMSGGAGVGDLRTMVEDILRSDIACRLIVLAGRNVALLESLQQLAKAHPDRLLPMGFTQAIERLMVAADVAITKPGGLTSAECLATGLPMIVVSPIPGQEERNADHLLECGAAVKAVDAAALVYKLRLLLQEPRRLAGMRRDATAAARPDAADRVLEVVRGTLPGKDEDMMHKWKQALALVVAGLGWGAVGGADRDEGPLEIVVYPAIATEGQPLQVEGRVIRREERTAVDAADGKRRNLARNLQLLNNKEVGGQAVSVSLGAAQLQGITDKEGYFRVEFPGAAGLAKGWHAVTASAGSDRGTGHALLAPPDATRAVVSDVDDTLLVTGVRSKRSMLGNSLLLNAAQREPVARMPELLGRLVSGESGAACCVIYLSATPRQLQGSVQSFLDRNGFPRGILVTKRVTNDRTSDSLRDQQRYKLARLEELFARLPQVQFTLLGDDAEADPRIYAEISRRHPGRVKEVWIRQTRGDTRRWILDGQGTMDSLLARTLDCGSSLPDACKAK